MVIEDLHERAVSTAARRLARLRGLHRQGCRAVVCTEARMPSTAPLPSTTFFRNASNISSVQIGVLWSRAPDSMLLDDALQRALIEPARVPARRGRRVNALTACVAASGPRNHCASGIEKPIFGRYMISFGRCGSIAFFSRYFCSPLRILMRRRQRRHPLDQRMVHQRLADLERMRHRRAVDLGVDVADEIGLQVDVLDLRERIVGRRAFAAWRSHHLDRVVAGELAPERRAVELLAQRRADHRHRVEVRLDRARGRAPRTWTWRGTRAAPSRPSDTRGRGRRTPGGACRAGNVERSFSSIRWKR